MDIKLLQNLVGKVKGVKKNETVVVIPSGKASGLLQEHLVELSKQNIKEFDVLVIGEAPESAPDGINVLSCKENRPLGSSGAFAIGQILGYLLGYRFVINADADCFPQSKNLVQGLVEAARVEKKVVLPAIDEEGKKVIFCINGYGIVSREIFEKIGFQYAVLFKGAEDIDFQLRLQSHGLLSQASNLRTTHPYLSMVVFEIAAKGAKYLYYYRAGPLLLELGLYRAICSLNAKDAFLWAGRIIYTYCCNFVFSVLVSKVLFCAMLDGFTINLGKKYGKEKFCILQIEIDGDARAFFLDTGSGNEKQTAYFGEWEVDIGLFGKVMRRVGHVEKFLGLVYAQGDYFKPSERFMESYEFFTPYIMFLKPVWYKGKIYSWGKGAAWLPVGIALLVVSLPLLPFIVALSLLKIFFGGDYPSKIGNVRRMLKNFEKIVL